MTGGPDSIGIGLVGCGQIARRRYLPMLMRRRDARITAVCTSSPESARRAAEAIGGNVAATADLDELLGNPAVDAVIISTPHRQHALQAARALRAGKHVLLEKPMATDWADAQALIEAAAKSPAKAMILPWEHVAQLRALQRWLVPANFGRISAVSADFSGPGAPPGRDWKYSLAASGGGVIVAHMVYALDLIASIMGPARRISAFAGTLLPQRRAPDGSMVPSDIEDNASVILEYGTGQHAMVRSVWAYAAVGRTLVIYGTRQSLIMASGGVFIAEPGKGGDSADALLFPGQTLRRVPVPREKENIVDHFLRCIREDQQPEAGIEQAAHVTEQMMLAYAAARTGEAQTLTTTFVPRTPLDRELFQ